MASQNSGKNEEKAKDGRSFDIVVPSSLLNDTSAGDSSVLIQIDPPDARNLDFEGATGAIGRFEADEKAITLDLKGFQYEGSIHPGPTAIVLAVKGDDLRVDSISDEFITLNKTSDLIAKLDAVVQGNTQGYQIVEEDANRKSNNKSPLTTTSEKEKAAATNPASKKRKFQSRRKK